MRISSVRFSSACIFVVVSAFSSTMLWAGETWDFKRAYQSALINDSTIRAARAAADAQRERLPQARAQLLPNIGLGIARNSNQLSRTQANLFGQVQQTEERYMSYNQTLTLRQPIYRKSLLAAVKQADYVLHEADATLDREQHNLVGRIANAYFDILLAQDRLAMISAQRRTTEFQLDAARKSMLAGAGTRTDIDEAIARLDLIVYQDLEAKEQLLYSRRQLEILVGEKVADVASLEEKSLLLNPPKDLSLDDWVALAEENSPDLKSLRARREIARVEVEKAESGHYPTLDAVAQITRSGSENVSSPSSSYTNRLVGLQLNIPLHSGGAINSSVRQAMADLVRTEELLEAARRDLGLKVHKEYRGVTEGPFRIRALEQAVRSSEQLVQSNKRSFSAGFRSILDVLNAEQRKQETIFELARARYEFLMAGVKIQSLAGSSFESTVLYVNDCLKKL